MPAYSDAAKFMPCLLTDKQQQNQVNVHKDVQETLPRDPKFLSKGHHR